MYAVALGGLVACALLLVVLYVHTFVEIWNEVPDLAIIYVILTWGIISIGYMVYQGRL